MSGPEEIISVSVIAACVVVSVFLLLIMRERVKGAKTRANEPAQSTAKLCSQCKRDLSLLPADIKVCPYCGKPLQVAEKPSPKVAPAITRKFCIFCGRELPVDARYCDQCGKQQRMKSS
jgi:predicted amidophosphoribosyltransferase